MLVKCATVLLLVAASISWGSFTNLGAELGINPPEPIPTFKAIDLDYDGDTDIFACGESGSRYFWENVGGAFVDSSDQLTIPADLATVLHFLDFDADGDLDIITGDAAGYLTLLMNDHGAFVDVSVQVGLSFDGLGKIYCGWFDDRSFMVYSNGTEYPCISFVDSDKDFYIADNTGSGFEISLLRDSINPMYHGSITVLDFNRDGKSDIITSYVPNGYFNIYNVHEQVLHVHGDVGFEVASTSLPSMPAYKGYVFDYNNDLYPDYVMGTPDYVQNGPEHPWLIQNINGQDLLDASTSSLNVGSHYYGTYFIGDYDNDGDVDVLQHINTWTYHRLMMNDGDGSFTDMTSAYNMSDYYGRDQGIFWQWFDFEQDGDTDLIGMRANGGSGIFLYRNDMPFQNYIDFEMISINGVHNVIPGLFLDCYFGGTRLFRCSDTDNTDRFHFGLGGASQVDSLIVHWPGGRTTKLYDIPANQFLTVRECDLVSQLYANARELGWVEPGLPVNAIVEVENRTCFALTIDSLACSSDAWHLPVDQLVVEANSTLELILLFDPPSYGHYTGTLSLFADTDSSNTEDNSRTDVFLEGYAGPIFPAISDLSITIDNELSSQLIWSALTETIYGNPAEPDYYIVYYNQDDPSSEADWYYQGASFDPAYTHLFAARHADIMNYRVMAYYGLPAVLESLEKGMKKSEVEAILQQQ